MAIFYDRNLIEFRLYRDDFIFRILFDASSLEILQLFNVRK